MSNLNIPNQMATPAVTTIHDNTDRWEACQSTDDVIVNVVTVLPVDAGPDQAICIGETIQLSGSGAVSYTWSPAAGLDNPNIPSPFLGDFNATITLLVRMEMVT